MSESIEKGMLYIVGTPIGNMEDITYRAIKTLNEVDIILAEDTRQTKKLLDRYEIKKPLISYHRHNEIEKIKEVTVLLDKNNNVALVSDAGMPIISDPGQALIKYLYENNYAFEVVPGVTALVTGIVGSAMDCTRFIFEGFLSVNKKQRKEKLELLKNETRTTVFYEAPHKILYTLKDMYNILGNRNICIARELTKIYEEYRHTTILDAIDNIERNGIKGEIVLIIEGANKEEIIENEKKILVDVPNIDLVKQFMESEHISKKDAIKKVAKLKGLSKNEVYKEVTNLHKI